MSARAWAVPAAVALWAAWAFAPLLGGYFLSDDFVPLALFHKWQEEGRLAAALAAKFWSGLDAGANNFYRPLSYLSFAASYLTSGVAAAPWMALDVLVHLASGVLVGAVALRAMARGTDTASLACAAAGAALFLFMPPTVEVVAWVSGRFDAFATLFTLLACERFLASRRVADGAWIASLLAAAAAMLSKESAAIVPFAIALFAWMRAEGAAFSRARIVAALRSAGPWLLLAVGYLLLRRAIFGSAFTVYGGSSPMGAALSAEFWRHAALAVPPWLASIFDSPRLLALAGILIAVQAGLASAARPADTRSRAALAATALAVLLTIALFLPAVRFLPPNGIGGRLLHQTAAFYGIFAAVALMCVPRPRALGAVTVALGVALAAMQQGVLARWHDAHQQSRVLVAEIARLARELPAEAYALVIATGSLHAVPFARNAQAGLMLPPVQARPLTQRLLVQIDEEIGDLPAKLSEGLVPTLRRGTVFDFVEGRRVRTREVEYPTHVVCWNARERRLTPLDIPRAAAPAQWAAGLQKAFDASPCTASPRIADVDMAPAK